MAITFVLVGAQGIIMYSGNGQGEHSIANMFAKDTNVRAIRKRFAKSLMRKPFAWRENKTTQIECHVGNAEFRPSEVPGLIKFWITFFTYVRS